MAQMTVRPLGPGEREIVVRHLERDPVLNLVLLDLALRLGEPPPSDEPAAELVGCFEGETLRAVAALRPTVVLDAGVDAAALDALGPHLAGAGSGMIKSREGVVAPLRELLDTRGRRALLDRIEIGYLQQPPVPAAHPTGGDWIVRPARLGDHEALVDAARASLRAENRPDAFRGDPAGFRRWVRGRIQRATVVECGGEVGFVGYADVQSPRGWLLQGVYTFPDWRRRGLARIGVSEICRAAAAARADHVQLAVVDGNEPAQRLYEGLGFRLLGRLRTLVFG